MRTKVEVRRGELAHQLLKVWRRKRKRQRSPATSLSRLRIKPQHPLIPVGGVAAGGEVKKRSAIVIVRDFAFENEPAAPRGEIDLLRKRTGIKTTVNGIGHGNRVPVDIIDQPILLVHRLGCSTARTRLRGGNPGTSQRIEEFRSVSGHRTSGSTGGTAVGRRHGWTTSALERSRCKDVDQLQQRQH